MDALRFLQFSDLHFQSCEYEAQWECSEEKAEIVEREMREVVEKIVTLAKEKEVEAILIPGDLFDDRTVTLDGIRFLQDCFQSLGGIPVLIVPGDKDSYGPSSFYNFQFLREIGMRPWPKNVHIFTEHPSSVFVLPGKKRVAFTGIPHIGRGLKKGRPLALPIQKDERVSNVLVFHGTWERNGSVDERGTMSFNREELHSHDFDYVAFGHVQSGEEIADEKGQIRGAASGCPYGRKTDETGGKRSWWARSGEEAWDRRRWTE